MDDIFPKQENWFKAKELKEELFQSKELLKQILNTAKILILGVDVNGCITVFNSFFERMSGWKMEELIGKHFEILLPKHEHKNLADLFRKILTGDDVIDSENYIITKTGEERLILWNSSILRNLQKEPYLILAVGVDITERKRIEEKITYMAYHDLLTKLPNRQLFYDKLKQAVFHAEWNSELLAVFFLDLDGFKEINDRFGHSVGDMFLKEISLRLRNAVRNHDTIARMGGDEFTLVIPHIRSKDDIEVVANKLLLCLSEEWCYQGHYLSVTGSIGISLYPDDGEEPDILLKNADTAMYYAKNSGKNNQFQLYSQIPKE